MINILFTPLFIFFEYVEFVTLAVDMSMIQGSSVAVVVVVSPVL